MCLKEYMKELERRDREEREREREERRREDRRARDQFRALLADHRCVACTGSGHGQGVCRSQGRAGEGG